MRKALFVLAVVVMVLGGAQMAFALHGGYANTGTNCSSCHAVHNATGYDLFPTTVKTNTQGAFAFPKDTGGAGGSVYNNQAYGLSASSRTYELCQWCHVYGNTDPVYQTGKT